MKKIALITGVTGQDGSYLAEFLIKKNYIWIIFGIWQDTKKKLHKFKKNKTF